MEVGHHAVAVRPGVRRPRTSAQLGEGGDAAAPADATGEHDVGLQHVDATAQHEVTRLTQVAHHLAAGQAEVRPRPQRGPSIDVPGVERLLEPVDADAFELTRDLRGRGHVPARRRVTFHAPTLVGVDHQLDRRTDRITELFEHGHVVAPVGVMKSDLHGPDPPSLQRLHPPDALLGGHQLARAGIGLQRLATTAQELPHRLGEGAADDIPYRDLDDPGARPMEVGGLTDLADHFRAERIEADEEALEDGDIGQEVARGVADDPLIRMHTDDLGLLLDTRDRVPRGPERRIERVAVAPDLDVGDLHGRQPSPSDPCTVRPVRDQTGARSDRCEIRLWWPRRRRRGRRP